MKPWRPPAFPDADKTCQRCTISGPARGSNFPRRHGQYLAFWWRLPAPVFFFVGADLGARGLLWKSAAYGHSEIACEIRRYLSRFKITMIRD